MTTRLLDTVVAALYRADRGWFMTRTFCYEFGPFPLSPLYRRNMDTPDAATNSWPLPATSQGLRQSCQMHGRWFRRHRGPQSGEWPHAVFVRLAAP